MGDAHSPPASNMSQPVPIGDSPSHRPEEDEGDLATLLSPGAGNAHQCTERLFSEEESAAEGMLGSIGVSVDKDKVSTVDEEEDEVSGGTEEGVEVFEAVEKRLSLTEEDNLGNDEEVKLGRKKSKESSEEDFEDALESVSPLRAAAAARQESLPEEDPPPLTARPCWRRRRRHFFILSEAGKPIYSLHGDEDELASLMAVMQAMVSYVAGMSASDALAGMALEGGGRIVFAPRPPLILVAVSWGAESERQLGQQITYLYNQLLSVLTLNQMNKIFEQRKGFDLRRMIAGSERLLGR